MERLKLKTRRHRRRKLSIRRHTLGAPNKPRLTVFRSARHIYAQVIDDLSGRTLVAASSNEKGGKADNGGNRAAASDVGKKLAERARGAGIEAVTFDRNGYKFHGRVRALADAAREGGLKF
jgi:large subunit ribosomal protein L18